MVTQYVEYVKSLGRTEGPGMDVRAMKTRLIDSKAARRGYIAGVAIIDIFNAGTIQLRDVYEAEFYRIIPQTPSITLDPNVHRIIRKPNSQVSITNPTLTGITQAEYQAVVDKCNKQRASA